jgi:PAS domain S-box-containing protein
MSAVVLGAMGSLGVLWNRQAGDTADQLTQALLAQKLRNVETRIADLLVAAERQGRVCMDLTPSGGLSAKDFLPVFAQLAPVFAQQQEFTYVGYAVAETGEYAMLERRDPNDCRMREFLLLPTGERIIRDHRVTRAGLVLERTLPWNGYDPRTRLFYEAARRTQEPRWTSSYVFQENDWHPPMLGVSHVVPIRDAQGALLGTWDVDFDVRRLSRFLQRYTAERLGYAFIIETVEGAAPALIAHPGMAEVRQEHGAASPIDPVLKAFLHAGTALGAEPQHLAHEQGEHLAARLRFQLPAPPWTVGVVIDREAALEPLARSVRWIWILALLLTGLAVLTAAWLAHRLWRPVENLRVAAEGLTGRSGLQTVPVEGPREMARLADTFNVMARAVETRRAEQAATNSRLQQEVRQRGQREAELEAVFANAPVEIWAVDLVGRYTLQSRRLRERCGECVGLRPSELRLPPEIAEEYERNNRRALNGEIVRGETTEPAEQGGVVHYHWIVAPIRIDGLVTGALGVSIDVTERHRAEDALQRSQQRLRLHLENTPLAVIDWSLEFTILSWNPAAEAVFGWSAAEALGRNGMFIVPEDERAGMRQVWSDLMGGRGGQRHCNQHITRDGRVIHCEWYNTMLTDENDRIIGVSSLVLDVSERLSAEALFRESEERFLHVFRASPVAKTISRRSDGTILDANDRFLLMADYRREQVIGKTSIELGLWEDPEDRRRFLQELEQGGEVRDREFRLRPRTGPVVDVIVSAAALPLGDELCLLLTFVDNTERKRAERALRENQRFLTTLIGQLPGMVYRCRNDRQRTMSFMSDGAKELTGYTPADLEHNRAIDFASLIHPDDRERVWQETQVALAGGGREFSYEYRLRHRSGDVRWVWERGEAQNGAHGEPPTLVGFITDITERKRAADEVLTLNLSLERRVSERTAELAAANERLKELDRLKSEFLATMSHELRTPLNSIIGFSSILRQGFAGPLNPEQEKQIDLVRGSARHLLALINDLLDLSRIESGRMEFFDEGFDLAEVLAEVETTLAPMVGQRGLRYTTELSESALNLHGDRKRIFQVVLNLANNAVKFTERGGVTVRAELGRDDLVIAVRDTGIGIKVEQIPLLFEAFRQIDGSARRLYEGTGLGLHLCQKLIAMMGGRIEVESEYGRGSCFTIRLPRSGLKPAPGKSV